MHVRRLRVRACDPVQFALGRRARRNRLVRIGVILIALAASAVAIVLAIWLLDSASLPSIVDDFRPA